MRTTVELSDPVHKRLKAEAAERGMRGFSRIVEEALSEHFQSALQRRRRVDAIAVARGAWRDMDVVEWERDVAEAWATWKPPQY
jgi:predicted transcriptional regulator